MATDFQMPMPATQYNNTSPIQYSMYSNTSQISPISSATATPQGSSPTSPRSSLSHAAVHTRQLRPLKSPLYVPAVLRPNQPSRKIKTNPLTPDSTQGSFESAGLSRSDSGDSGKWGLGMIVETEWSVKDLGEVTDVPSKDHWKPDSEATLCDAASCTRTFSYFTRRHHCRRCGNIFCDAHSPYLIPLDQNASFHPFGHPSRACDFCWGEYKSWRIARGSRAGSRADSEDGTTADDAATPVISCAPKKLLDKLAGVGMVGGQPESVAASVPKDWNWSTF